MTDAHTHGIYLGVVVSDVRRGHRFHQSVDGFLLEFTAGEDLRAGDESMIDLATGQVVAVRSMTVPVDPSSPHPHLVRIPRRLWYGRSAALAVVVACVGVAASSWPVAVISAVVAVWFVMNALLPDIQRR